MEVLLFRGGRGLGIRMILNLLKKHKILLLILLLGVFLRVYQAREFFLYSHDQDLAGWIIRDILSGHLRLVGQETSQHGVFIGPLFYYLLVPFYLLAGMDPIGGVVMVTLIALVSMVSIYWVVARIFEEKTGLVAALLYATSFSIVLTDREVVPTTPVMLWTIWFFYSIYLTYKGKQAVGFVLFGLLVGLIWNLNMGLILLSPLVLIAFWFSGKKLNLKMVAYGLGALLVTSLPLLLFEVRHGFMQFRAILTSFSGGGGGTQFGRVMELVSKNATRILWGEELRLPGEYAFYFLVLVFGFLLWRGVVRPRLGLILALWLGIFILFFSINSLVVSEYYLNGMNVIWIVLLGAFVSYLMGRKQLRMLAMLGLLAFVLINLYRFYSHDINASGYIQRKAIVAAIKKDALEHDYPCVAVSYITDPGRDLGYRYLFYLEGMHVNKPKSDSPVYTIVFPHSLVDRIDRSYGALGLILPEYERYDEDEVALSCSGENANLTDPLFGYVD